MLEERMLTIKLSNGEEYRVPAKEIFKNHAKYHRDEFDTYEESLQSTSDLFNGDIFETYDWVRQMYWFEIKTHAIKIKKEVRDFDEMLSDSIIEMD